MGNKITNQIVQKRADTLEQFQEDVVNANKILKAYKDSSGNIITLTLDITDFDLVKETNLWKLFVRVYVSLVKSDISSQLKDSNNSDNNVVSSNSSSSSSSSDNNSSRIDKTNVQNILKYSQFYQFTKAVQEIIESNEQPLENNSNINKNGNRSRNNSSSGNGSSRSLTPNPSISVEDLYKRAKLNNSWQIEDARECPICFEEADQLCVVACGHEFCSSCIEQWRSRNNTCPMCRSTNNAQDEMDFVLVDEAPPEEISNYFQTILKDTR